MQTRILDLDGSLLLQPQVAGQPNRSILPLRDWGPRLRIACSKRAFARFDKRLMQLTGNTHDTKPFVNFLGSGDFHHVSLALLRRLRGPFNLLVLDNHSDWICGVPLLHCGTWLLHAAQLPGVQRIFHLGGDADFDNAYRWLTPWPLLRSGRVVVGPARRRFQGHWWNKLRHRPLRCCAERPADHDDIEAWLSPYREELAAWPLYISLDKDVLLATESVVNWDSGHLTVPEVLAILKAFASAANDNLLGVDVVGDWSPIRVQGLLRRFLHWSEHPELSIDPDEAAQRNAALNLRLLDCLHSARLGSSKLARCA